MRLRSFSVSRRPTVVGLVAVDDHREGVDRVAGQQHVELDEVGGLRAVELVVERGVAARARLELVEEVEHDFGERQVVGELYALGREIVHAGVLAAALLAELHDRADVLPRGDDRRPGCMGSRISAIVPGSGMSEGLWTSSSSPFVKRHVEPHRGHRRQQLEVVLALEALAHDVHVQQPEEAAAKAEAERVGGLGLPRERRVVERELLERVAQVGVAVGVDREEPAEDHRLDLAVAGQRLAGLTGARRACLPPAAPERRRPSACLRRAAA